MSVVLTPQTEEIRDELAELDPSVEFVDVMVRPYAYRTSHRLAELDVRHADGTCERLILKDLGRQSLEDDARDAKPAFLLEPLREIEVYRDILAGADLGTAALRGAVVRPEEDRYWLLLERLEGVELYQTGALADWRLAAARLAELHGRLGAADAPHLLRFDRDIAAAWIERAVRFSDAAPVLRLARRFDELVDRLLCLPQGLIHGELYASNVVVDVARERVTPIDWETAGIGPQLLDLAALTAGNWSEAARVEIALAYRDAADGGSGGEAFLADLDACRLYVAVQWLGWSPNWTPPPAHAHDWARDVAVLGRRLGLL